MKSNNKIGHMAALISILIWGTTFIATKILLRDFQPVEILLFRFVIGLLILEIVSRKFLKGTNWRQEILFAAAGLCGICLYYLLENIALTYTMASNVGVIISVAPFFTAMIARIFEKNKESLSLFFFAGFLVAMTGIAIISFQSASLKINPKGDVLAVLAALVWACYSVLTKKISEFGYQTILITKRIFLYGILFILPVWLLSDTRFETAHFLKPINLFNFIFLGVGASAFCFVSWNAAVKILGAVKTSIYIYMVPVVTVITSVVILHEKLTKMSCLGIMLTLFGLFLSERRKDKNESIIY